MYYTDRQVKELAQYASILQTIRTELERFQYGSETLALHSPKPKSEYEELLHKADYYFGNKFREALEQDEHSF